MRLTATQGAVNLYAPLQREVVIGLSSPTKHKGDKTPLSTVVFLCPSKIINTGLIRIYSSMVGCIEQSLIRLAVSLCGTANSIQSTAQDLAVQGGGLYSNKGHKPMNTYAQNPLNISVSEIKKQSLQKQAEIINHALSIFCMNANGSNRNSLKNDALELVRMLDDLPTSKSSSRFNVLNKSKKLIAERIPFDQARQYQDCIVKFSGMEVSA